VVLSGAGWRNESYLCLVLVARRKVHPFATAEVLDELQRIATAMHSEGAFRRDPWPILKWYLRRVRRIEPAPLGKLRSRDVKDDPYLACALSAKANCLVTRDSDLLVLQKPFGIEVLTPRAFMSRIATVV
jgi:uncharacterized protein